ncbi:hypothetical protein BH09PLA1_BH09PLA1_14310 [soil metagenome]
MPYLCPRCNDSVRRGTSKAAGFAGGAIGALIYSAFGAFQCKQCGSIRRSEFPATVRRKMIFGSVVIVALAFGIVVGLVALLNYVQK